LPEVIDRFRELRRLIHDDKKDQLVVEIDEQELRLEQFGKLLPDEASRAGLRITLLFRVLGKHT
jgi:hypothetical protein